MTIRRQRGFTLIEIIVVIAILGILTATAVPVYNTWQMRARGSEVKIMAKQILDAQIVYYMDHNKFYPVEESSIEIYHNDPYNHENVQKVSDNLNITIPTSHFLNYSLISDNLPGDEKFLLEISSSTNAEIFSDSYLVMYTINKYGDISVDYL